MRYLDCLAALFGLLKGRITGLSLPINLQPEPLKRGTAMTMKGIEGKRLTYRPTH